jgi:hypothetical protein
MAPVDPPGLRRGPAPHLARSPVPRWPARGAALDGTPRGRGPGASGAEDGGSIPHRRALRIRRLAPTTARRYHDDWAEVVSAFDDDPEGAVHDADRLITMAMLDRGFPVDDLDRREDELRTRHGTVVATYHAAHAIALAEATTHRRAAS